MPVKYLKWKLIPSKWAFTSFDLQDTIFANKFFITKQILQKEDTVIDVGAHVGGHTLFYSTLVGSNGLVISYEANPYVYTILRKRTQKLCSFCPVIVHQKAVSNTINQFIQLAVTPYSLSQASTVEKELMHKRRMGNYIKKLSVTTDCLD